MLTPQCPKCGGDMVRRENGTTGDPFWGCAIYPRCNGTRPISEAEKMRAAGAASLLDLLGDDDAASND